VAVLDSQTGKSIRRLTRSVEGGADTQVQVGVDWSHVYVARELTSFADPRPRSAIVRVPVSGGPAEVLVRIRGLVESFAASPDDRFLVYSVSRPDRAWVRLRDLTSDEESRLKIGGSGFTFSPNGDRIAYMTQQAGSWGIGFLKLSEGSPSKRGISDAARGQGRILAFPTVP
jgi:Tol biopolymer transport system component